MGHNGCDGAQASGPWAIGSGYRFISIQNGHKQDGTRVQGIPTLLSEMPKQACVAYWHWSRLIAKGQTEYVKDKLTKPPAQSVNVQRNVHTTLNQALIHPQTGENLSVYCTLDMVKVYVRTLFPKVDATSLLEDETAVWRYRSSPSKADKIGTYLQQNEANST